MAIYSFNTNLLSAAKTGTPNLLNTSLTAAMLSVVSLSTNDVGIAYNSLSSQGKTSTGTISSFTVQGSVFSVDTGHHGTIMAIVKSLSNNIQPYTTFVYSSALSTIATSSLSTNDDIMTPDSRRKYLLGYI